MDDIGSCDGLQDLEIEEERKKVHNGKRERGGKNDKSEMDFMSSREIIFSSKLATGTKSVGIKKYRLMNGSNSLAELQRCLSGIAQWNNR